ncbi:uncharacterized protein TM35_000311720 [Trypanosoma theileri]|uniref:Uncharacterized protein n=1 Tax=Trypanosoma theileri TaxID=67003 RepID=A0A1X0NMN5_9TRYP|nr:uncharacterized protein TM35_000311720 [Trypanosoma theileri]ORC85986.1 hypothetical protein TM35_000311720 [Trypanosoma theileri]
MQTNSVSTTTTPPIALIRWWFTKTKEERQEFLQSRTTSEKARENIHVVECFAKNHSYFVACATNLEVCPLPPLTSVPGCTLLGWEYGVWLPLSMHDETTYGGRYAPTQSREIRRRVTHRLLNEVRARTAMVLRDYNTSSQTTSSSQQTGNKWVYSVSNIIVETLVEACMAAVYRLGLPDALEKIENEKAQSAATVSQNQRYTEEEAATQPVGARRATAHASLGVWMLLCSKQARRGTGESEGELIPSAASISGFMCGGKRGRNNDNNTDGVAQVPHDAEKNTWRMLREQLAPPTEDTLYHKSNDGDQMDDYDGLMTTLVPHTSPLIKISALDMRFGIAKALNGLRKCTV